MKITALQEYGLRCLLQLAEGQGQPVQIHTIAKMEGISPDYVGKILSRLRVRGLVKSVRGLNGGYVLYKNPQEISVGSVIQSLSEKPIQMNHLKRDLCGQFPGNRKECVHLKACNVRQLWSMVILQVYGKLNQISLASLLGPEAEVYDHLTKLIKNSGLKEEVMIS